MLETPKQNKRNTISRKAQQAANPNLMAIDINGFNDPKLFKGNLIKTSKYTILNFLPKNMAIQFSKLANVYFLIICIL